MNKLAEKKQENVKKHQNICVYTVGLKKSSICLNHMTLLNVNLVKIGKVCFFFLIWQFTLNENKSEVLFYN